MFLSKKEREFLHNPQAFEWDYRYVLEHRIRKKLGDFMQGDYPLIQDKLTEFRKLTDNGNLFGKNVGKFKTGKSLGRVLTFLGSRSLQDSTGI